MSSIMRRSRCSAWVQATRFDFEAFICDEDLAAKPKKPSAPPEPKRGKKKGAADEGLETPTGPVVEYVDKSRRNQDKPEDEAFTVEKAAPTELQRQLREMEEQFMALEGGFGHAGAAGAVAAVGGAKRCARRIRGVRHLLAQRPVGRGGRVRRGGVAMVPHGGRRRAGAAGRRRRNRSWASRVSTAADQGREIADDDLDRLLALPEPSGADLRALAAYLVWSARRESPPQAVLQRLNTVRSFLEAHERLLPVRAVWLAWAHLVRLSRRRAGPGAARDRLLERLYHNGLRPEQDLPGFLRFAGPATGQRFRGVGQWLRSMARKGAGLDRPAGKGRRQRRRRAAHRRV